MQLVVIKDDRIQYYKESRKIAKRKKMYMAIFHAIQNRKICSFKMKRINWSVICTEDSGEIFGFLFF